MILFLTARSRDYSQIAGFEAGAGRLHHQAGQIKVLLSRIKALLKRHKHTVEDSGGPSSDRENIAMDPERFLVYIGEASCTLPKKEFELLQLLMSKPERVFTRDEIFNAIWGDDVIVGDRTIAVHIRKLRERIGVEYIKPIKGVGYKFTEA
jgi:two-component system alkaline phosphatase synthesis response regulator PhoP